MKLLTILSPLLIFGISLSTPNNHSLNNIDIFGEDKIQGIYILSSDMTEYLLLEKDFVHDAYFFQNIDRESFESSVSYKVPVKDTLQ
jgi:hypothetical protein